MKTNRNLNIIFYIIMIILEIIFFIKTKELAYINCGLLWVLVAVIENTNKLIIKSKDENIYIQKKLINKYKEFLERIERINDYQIIKVDDIYIPEYFVKPRKEKLKERKTYFELNKNFENPIVLDENNMLIDGYTSYLIAKENKLSHVYVRRG